MANLNAIVESLLQGHTPGVEKGIRDALDRGVSGRTIWCEGLIRGMEIAGEKFKQGEIGVPDLLFIGQAMRTGKVLIDPHLVAEQVAFLGKLFIGTVEGEWHGMGKQVVGLMLEGAGFEVINLGVNVSADAFVEAVAERGAELVCMSAQMTSTLPAMEVT
ncbi:MAG: cobalamin-dependent protein, partial [bacterium]|nr:cobalamin-dependent protein [bacterium]